MGTVVTAMYDALLTLWMFCNTLWLIAIQHDVDNVQLIQGPPGKPGCNHEAE